MLLAGDASNRRYERLHEPAGGKTYVLMDAPPEKGEDTRPFTHIAQHLLGCGLSAPEILAADHHNGFLVLEDFGDALFSSLLRESPAREQPLYEHAASALVALHKADQPDQVPVYGPAEMADLAGLAADWYASALADADPGALRAQLTDEIQHLLEAAPQMPPVLVLRDFHSDNLIWLPKRAGPAKVGLLDFQDAAIGNPAYDVCRLPMMCAVMCHRKRATLSLAFIVPKQALIRQNLRMRRPFARCSGCCGLWVCLRDCACGMANPAICRFCRGCFR